MIGPSIWYQICNCNHHNFEEILDFNFRKYPPIPGFAHMLYTPNASVRLTLARREIGIGLLYNTVFKKSAKDPNFGCIPSSSWPSLASKCLVLPHFVLCLKVLCLLVLHWIVLSHLLLYWFGLLPLRPHIVWDFPVWSFSILSSLVFVLYHMVL